MGTRTIRRTFGVLWLLWALCLLVFAGCGDEGGITASEGDNVTIETGDGTGTEDGEVNQVCEDMDGDGYKAGPGCPVNEPLDCDDKDSTVNPGAQEICGNGIDDDCKDGDAACEGPCKDLDNDTYPGKTAECPSGTDCDDADKDLHPGAEEICGNGIDEDCDGVDAECPPKCIDDDSDGYQAKTVECPQGTDCDDKNNTIHPNAVEICGNGIDEDCDGVDAKCPPKCIDDDSDGYQAKTVECPQGTDCDDKNNTIHPNAVEICGNGIDEDCDGMDEPCPKVCEDGDGDGYGNGPGCIDYDCNDANPAVHPNAEEVCGNGIDDDCVNGDEACPATCEDKDGDGFGAGAACVIPDCNDEDPSIYPGAEEICGNGIDEDCNYVDLPCTCLDLDGDGYGQGDNCLGPDCDDSNPAVNPGATEICGNGLDDDCKEGDEECVIPCVDEDNDGFYAKTDECPEGDDCNDADFYVHPGASEVCENGIDENCDGKDDPCPPPTCEDDSDCDPNTLCDQATGTCRYAKVWEWYAPTFYVDTDPKGEGLDLPRAVNFDGDWNAKNNVNNIATGAKDAIVYYSFVKTSTHWYLGYYLFFPKRWSSWGFLGTTYENTMRSVLVIVEQDGTMYGKPVLMETQSEDTWFQYLPAGSKIAGAATKDGEINYDLSFPTQHHPVAYVHSQDHGIWGDAYWGNNVDNWDIKGFPGGDGVVYRFGNVAEVPVGDNDEVYYELKAVVDELWPKRFDVGSSKLFDKFGHFNYKSNTSDSKSVAPWRISDANEPLLPEGEVLYDPADMVRRHFADGWGAFSFAYVYNPYAIKITLKDLTVKEPADPFGGAADPFINLYVRDGGGWEQLVLSNFYGLQNNWWKQDVPPGTLLDLQVELGGRNYFYGFQYPNQPLFGIEVRDYDGGWTGDDWLMKEEKKHEYDFTGLKFLDWEKSDSVIVVEVP